MSFKIAQGHAVHGSPYSLKSDQIHADRFEGASVASCYYKGIYLKEKWTNSRRISSSTSCSSTQVLCQTYNCWTSHPACTGFQVVRKPARKLEIKGFNPCNTNT